MLLVTLFSFGMISFPFCKINLGLRVTARRPDGYHELETCFYPLPWTDVLEIIPAAPHAFHTTGYTIPGKEEDNLCLKAYRLLQHDFNLPPVQIHLHKIIPMGAGLGGGSSDAAFVLRTLNDIFALNLSVQKLQEYAARLGSDCSYFIQDKAMLGTGRGEILTPIEVSLQRLHYVLVKPDIHVSTAEAYAGIVPRPAEKSITQILQQPIATWRHNLVNDFEYTVFVKHPLIADIKATLYNQGALYASMSGSGSSVFGLFAQPVDLQYHFRGMIYRTGELN